MSAKPLDTWRRLGREALWPERRPLVWAFVCMAVLGVATGAYAFLTGPVLRYLLLGGAGGLSLPLGLGRSIALPADEARRAVPFLIVGIGIVRGLAYLGQFYAVGWFGQRVAARMRRQTFATLLQRSPLALTRELTGELLLRLTGDIGSIESAATYAVASFLRDGTQLLVLVGIAFALDWRLALVSFVVLPLVGIPTARVSRNVLGKLREGQRHLGAVAAEMEEGLRELPTLQGFNAEAAALARLDVAAREHRQVLVKAAGRRAAVPALTELVAASVLAGVLAWSLSHGTPSASVISFLVTLVLMYQPAKDLGRYGQLALQAAVAAERLHDLVAQAPGAIDPGALDPEGTRAAPALREAWTLDDVHFAYRGRTALQGASLIVPLGKVTALVGPSGAGKSTVARLLLRSARPDRGVLKLDGVDVDAFSADSLRAQLALVSQEPLLFSGSVRENLRFARPEATDAELETACRTADAHGFIQALPQGYDTLLSERGGGLSGGQRQRLCLARALLVPGACLVLDEATASLDPESERQVQDALDRALPGRTALVISHRLQTVRNADRIYVMDAGRVEESGRHEELLAQNGLYARLWNAQGAGPAASL